MVQSRAFAGDPWRGCRRPGAPAGGAAGRRHADSCPPALLAQVLGGHGLSRAVPRGQLRAVRVPVRDTQPLGLLAVAPLRDAVSGGAGRPGRAPPRGSTSPTPLAPRPPQWDPALNHAEFATLPLPHGAGKVAPMTGIWSRLARPGKGFDPPRRRNPTQPS